MMDRDLVWQNLKGRFCIHQKRDGQLLAWWCSCCVTAGQTFLLNSKALLWGFLAISIVRFQVCEAELLLEVLGSQEFWHGFTGKAQKVPEGSRVTLTSMWIRTVWLRHGGRVWFNAFEGVLEASLALSRGFWMQASGGWRLLVKVEDQAPGVIVSSATSMSRALFWSQRAEVSNVILESQSSERSRIVALTFGSERFQRSDAWGDHISWMTTYFG